jgi:phage shock protein PspC (stress-responsive transcriptional regulator)
MTATTAEFQNAETFASEPRQLALPLRGDTFLGVCEAIGQDFGFNPNWLRVAFAPVIMVSPATAIGAYLAIGSVVAVTRLLFPNQKRVSANAASSHEAELGMEEEERLAA